MSDLPSAHPVRDLFDVAARVPSVRLTCRECRHSSVVSSHALWWLFHKKGWRDGLDDARGRCVCLMCLHRTRRKVRKPEFELVADPPTEASLPMPPEMDWKRELRRRR